MSPERGTQFHISAGVAAFLLFGDDGRTPPQAQVTSLHFLG